MIFTDPSYDGMTHNYWDQKLDFEYMWEHFSRVIKNNGCIAIWAQSPFSHKLAMSNEKLYRYEWVIEKIAAKGFLNANRMPLRAHENVMIFYKKLPIYNPQKIQDHDPVHSFTKNTSDGTNYGNTKLGISGGGSTERFPRDVLKFSWDTQKSSLHPTQKPLAACEYFIKTYTNPGMIVLDPFMGSNTTGLACQNLGREYIGIEMDEDIFKIGITRVSKSNL